MDRMFTVSVAKSDAGKWTGVALVHHVEPGENELHVDARAEYLIPGTACCWMHAAKELTERAAFELVEHLK